MSKWAGRSELRRVSVRKKVFMGTASGSSGSHPSVATVEITQLRGTEVEAEKKCFKSI